MTRHNKKINIAYFISSHGFGHASRASAVMEAFEKIEPSINFEIFTLVPEWFFEESLSDDFMYNVLISDIGMVQKTPFDIDVSKTLQELDAFLPFNKILIKSLANKLKDKNCQIIICDISPLGIAVAKDAGIKSVLIENFTWDWIYEEYCEVNNRFLTHIKYLDEQFQQADFRIQTQPACYDVQSDLSAVPVSRKHKKSQSEIRKQLGVSESEKMIMITMGGIPERFLFFDKLRQIRNVRFIIPGSVKKNKTEDNLILLSHNSGFFHPDLVNACDAIVGKVGYSTLAEAFSSGAPFAYVLRENFRESLILEEFVRKNMQSFAIENAEFYNGSWLQRVPELLALPKKKPDIKSGAEQVARFLQGLI